MIYGHKHRALSATVFLLSIAISPAAAEELLLKDGQKIVGTIVGFENDMFRVETEFGFALVRKDKIATVKFVTGGTADTAKKRGEMKSSTGKPSKPPAGNPEKATTSATPEIAKSPDNPSNPLPTVESPPPPPVKESPPPPPVSRPLNEPLPPHLEERVEGTNYVNDTFHFAMYKPPGWKVFEAVPRETGAAIVALGTEDEQTLLFVDRQAWSGPPDLKGDQDEVRLRQTYQEYQKLSESPVQLDGRPALRRVFKGLLDGVQWYGVSVHVAQGNSTFGITGLTSAETFEFQQALFAKIMNSFHFLNPASNPTAPTSAVATK